MDKKLKKQNILWLILFLMSLGLMVWKLPYGFGGDDEGFYLTVAHRLTLGQRLFTDEWHLSQLSSFFLYPFVKLFRDITGGTEGILLASRVLYIVCHSLTAAVVYLRLRRFGALSVLGTIFFLLFTPFDMMTCSYNTIALDMLALTAAFASPVDGADAPVLSGIFFACAVVCCPYLAVGYVLYLAVCIVYSIIFKSTGKEYFNYPLFRFKTFWFFTFGIALSAAAFLLFLLSHTSVKEIIAALPGLFSDPEHPSNSVFFMLKHYVWCILTSHRLAFIPLCIYALSLLILVFDKNRRKHCFFHIILPVIACVFWLSLMSTELTGKYFNGIMLPLSLLGLSAYLLLEYKPRGLFCSCFVLGLLYSLCVCSTSNMGFDILSISFSVMNIAGFVFIGLLISEQRGRIKKALIAICLIPVVLFAVMSLYVKINHCFWDDSPSKLDFEITAGPAKGIITNSYFAGSYNNIFYDMQTFTGKEGKILVYSQQAWEYLIPDMPYASFSAWLSGLDDATLDRLSLYYRMNSGNIPDYIYIPKASAFGELNTDKESIYEFADERGYSIEENDIGFKLRFEDIS